MTPPETARSLRQRAIPVLVLLAAPGCGSLRETAGAGQDLLENPARTAVVRAPAGIGAIAGYVLAVPFAAVLAPTVWIPSTYVRNADQGDVYISPVSASFDYGHGIGAAFLGAPFDALEGLFREEPGLPPPGTVDEERELPAHVPDEDFDFSVKPLAEAAEPSGEAPEGEAGDAAAPDPEPSPDASPAPPAGTPPEKP